MSKLNTHQSEALQGHTFIVVFFISLDFISCNRFCWNHEHIKRKIWILIFLPGTVETTFVKQVHCWLYLSHHSAIIECNIAFRSSKKFKSLSFTSSWINHENKSNRDFEKNSDVWKLNRSKMLNHSVFLFVCFLFCYKNPLCDFDKYFSFVFCLWIGWFATFSQLVLMCDPMRNYLFSN